MATAPAADTRPRPNWPLIGGSAIVLLLIAVALIGPLIAPRDPLQRTLIAEIGGRTRGVPFPPFASWEFPLGSDRFGRDLLSRLLWAVRPTLLMIALVGTVRLALGVLIGLVAGWSARGPGRAFSWLIDAALSIPVLVVALAAITAVGIETGLIAFVVGMALTGWSETAQSVRAQTQLVAVQPYIQAARALGATGAQVVLRHVSRHILPLLTMLFAFELSATLMLTAALSFLGYFIGGGVWIILDGDGIPAAQRVSGPPELGQLLGTSQVLVSSQPPWEMIFPGLVVVLDVLGFSLLGEGLRRRIGRPPATRRSLLGQLFGGIGGRLEAALVTTAGRWDERAVGRFYGLAGSLALAAVATLWWQNRPSEMPTTAVGAPLTAGLAETAGWAAERGDAYGTLSATIGPSAAPALAWEFNDPAGLSGGPAVASDGTIYVASLAGALQALAPDGSQRWRVELPEPPVGAPALGADGTIYVVDRRGGLSAFAPDGSQRWRFASSYRSESSGGPIVGPDGTIYYTLLDGVQAVTPAGQGRWVGRDADLPYLELVPRLSPTGDLIFLKSSAFSTVDGSLQQITIVPGEPVFADPSFLVGADGRTYYRSEHRLVPWRRVEQGVAVQQPLTWAANSVIFLPNDVGVTAAGTAWMVYSTDYADTRVIWIGEDGALIGESFFPLRAGRALAASADGTLQICGRAQNNRLQCAAVNPSSGESPLWRLDVGPAGATAQGGAAIDGRLYVVDTRGTLYALE